MLIICRSQLMGCSGMRIFYPVLCHTAKYSTAGFILAQVMSKTKLSSVGQNIFLEMQLDSGLAYGHPNTEMETTSTACSMNF